MLHVRSAPVRRTSRTQFANNRVDLVHVKLYVFKRTRPHCLHATYFYLWGSWRCLSAIDTWYVLRSQLDCLVFDKGLVPNSSGISGYSPFSLCVVSVPVLISGALVLWKLPYFLRKSCVVASIRLREYLLLLCIPFLAVFTWSKTIN